MERPIALKLGHPHALEAYRVNIEADTAKQLMLGIQQPSPAIVITRDATILPDISAGIIDAAKLDATIDGSWSNAILLVVKSDVQRPEPLSQEADLTASGDERFLAHVERKAKELTELARQTLSQIRSNGVDGELVEKKGGRWVNWPLNTFTLKAQPRAGNLQFTLYGNPDSYEAEGFLLRDQNSYSRGWVHNAKDAQKLAMLTQESHSRRKR